MGKHFETSMMLGRIQASTTNTLHIREGGGCTGRGVCRGFDTTDRREMGLPTRRWGPLSCLSVEQKRHGVMTDCRNARDDKRQPSQDITVAKTPGSTLLHAKSRPEISRPALNPGWQ